jgi:hypothetical protein
MGHPQVRWSGQLMTQNGVIPAQFQGDREGRRPATTKSDGMCRQEFQDALDRIKYIEKKLGIESGV